MKLVVDIDNIMTNANSLKQGIANYYTEFSSFSSTNMSFDTVEVQNIINSYIDVITNDLNELYNSSTSYLELVDECCSKYQSNEASPSKVDISNITSISVTDNATTSAAVTRDELVKPLPIDITSGANKQIDLSKVKEGSKVAKALEKYGDEIKNATYAKINENIFLLITDTTVAGSSCYVSHIVVENPKQIFGEPANGTYASGLETSTSAAKRTGASLVINGSHFDYSNGAEDLKGNNHIIIADGEVKASGYAGGMEICLDNNGRMFTSNKSSEELLNEGVVYTFSSHGAPMITNGAIDPVCYQETRAYNRTVIGMVEPCDYYVVTDTSYQSQTSTANYLLEKGCTFAKSLDQGGSVSLTFDGKLINNPTDGSERAVGDFICFSS